MSGQVVGVTYPDHGIKYPLQIEKLDNGEAVRDVAPHLGRLLLSDYMCLPGLAGMLAKKEAEDVAQEFTEKIIKLHEDDGQIWVARGEEDDFVGFSILSVTDSNFDEPHLKIDQVAAPLTLKGQRNGLRAALLHAALKFSNLPRWTRMSTVLPDAGCRQVVESNDGVRFEGDNDFYTGLGFFNVGPAESVSLGPKTKVWASTYKPLRYQGIEAKDVFLGGVVRSLEIKYRHLACGVPNIKDPEID